MDGYGIGQVEMVTMGPELASQWLTRYHYPRQRTPSTQHINFLAAEMRAGRFTAEAMYLVHLGERAYLTDGQHRLHAIIASETSQPVAVVHLNANTEEDVDKDYIRRDCGRPRTVAQAYDAMGLSEVVGLTDTQINHLGAACQVLLCGFSSVSGAVNPLTKSRDVRYEMILEWGPYSRSYIDAIHGAYKDLRKALTRSAVMAVALVTMRHQPEKATAFWAQVARNELLKRGDPEWALIRYFSGYNTMNRARHEYARAVANAWNAHYAGRSLQLVKVASEQLEKPIFIAGTPYDGQKTLALEFNSRNGTKAKA